MTMEDRLLVPREAASYLKISVATLRRAVRRGDLRHTRVGRLLRFRRDWLEQLASPTTRQETATADQGRQQSIGG